MELRQREESLDSEMASELTKLSAVIANRSAAALLSSVQAKAIYEKLQLRKYINGNLSCRRDHEDCGAEIGNELREFEAMRHKVGPGVSVLCAEWAPR